ncbi:MAG TPA: HD-GYP domain-containing protein [Allosphingosinicella sp.]|jgi:HD-GYP domain-containing protein (c-di-GMP phosphodiesterase class II)|nr:HD-GYP domain-containing protein [Allosphingosinicella sp.]
MRVRKEDLRLGMYIQSLDGSWFDHPFWKTKFLLSEQDDLRALQSSEVEAVWIDEDKSLAPAIAHLVPQAPAPTPSPAAALREELAAKPKAPSARPGGEKASRQPFVDHNAYRAAEKLVADCKAAVVDLLARVHEGDGGALDEAAPVVSGIAESVARNSDAFLTLVRVRTLDEYSYMHSIAVSALMINLARELTLPPDYIRQAGTAGLFMDVGKAFLPPVLLSKRDDYTETDRAQMQRHPSLGGDAVKASGELSKIVADVCLHHHERWDGSGYPFGLKGDEISLFARMAAICDMYDALCSVRPHRPARGPADAVAEMYRLKGQLDESLLTTFIRSIGVYPSGSLVRLESRLLACVVAQRQDHLTRPVVRPFYSIPHGTRVAVYEMDLAEEPQPDRIVSREDPRRWGFADWDNEALAIIQGQKAKRAA